MALKLKLMRSHATGDQPFPCHTRVNIHYMDWFVFNDSPPISVLIIFSDLFFKEMQYNIVPRNAN
jgi:hypothetical protein